jgi:molybdopterin-guanine dinucleotide biosynthesis protein A
MSSYPPPGGPPPGGVGRRIEEAMELIEMELRHAVAYVNDAIVPQVRSESISAMRTLADKLRILADRLDQKGPGPR